MKKIITRLLAVSIFLLLSALSVNAATYYSQATGGTVVANFNTSRTGGGSAPANFTTSGDIFIIQGTGGGLSAPHTLTSGSSVTFGAGVTLEVEGGATLVQTSTITMNATATFKLDAGSFYQHNSTSYSNFAAGIEDWNSSATITYTKGGFIPNASITGGTYPNVVLNNGGNVNLAGAITNIAGNLTVTNGATSVTLTGATALNMTIGGNLVLTTASTFDLGNGVAAPTINIGGNISIASSISFTYSGSGGSATLNFTKSGTQTFSNAGTMAAKVINYTVNNGSTLDLGTNVISGTGTFTVANGGGIITANTNATGALTTSGANGSIQVTGTRTYNTGGNYTFNGASAQVAGNGLTGANNLAINNSAGVTLSNPTTVSGTLTLTSGKLTSTATNLLTLGSSATVSGGNSSNYVVGPMQHTIATTSSTAKTFPIGKTYYSPVVLTITQSAANSTTYKAEVFETGIPSRTLPGTISAVSNNRYYVLSSSGSLISNGSIGLVYDANDVGILTGIAGDMRIVNDQGSASWINVGPSAGGSSAITSDVNFTTLGNFAIANGISGTVPDTKTVTGTAAICPGSSTNITLASSQSGVTYDLYKNGVAQNDTKIGDGNDLIWSVSAIGTYTVKTTAAGGYSVTLMSGNAVITVNPATSISAQSTATQTKFVGEAFSAMTVTASGTGTVNYQWKSSDDAVTNTIGDDVTVGTNSNSFTPSSVSAGTKYYYCLVSSDCGSNVTSTVSEAIITNNPVPNVVLTSGSNSTSVNVNAAMTAAVYTYSFVVDDANMLANWYTDNTYVNTTTAPSGLSITKNTGTKTVTVSGTPANGVYGTLYYKLIVNETGGNYIEGTITVNVPTPTITLSSSVGTNAQIKKANTAITSITYTVTNASGATIGTLPTGLSGLYSNGTYTISGTIDVAATLGTANYTVTATPYIGYGGSDVIATGSVVIKSATAKEICYLVAGATQSANDTQIYPNLIANNNYIVTLRTAAGTAPAASVYDNYDLIVATEVVTSTNPELLALKAINKPILNFKSFVYQSTSGRWNWGAPDNGKTGTTGTISVKQPSHPIFAGLTLTIGTLDILSNVTSGNMIQVVDLTLSGGISVALAPKSTTGNPMATAIHDVPGSVRGAGITSRYILIPIADGNFGKVNADGLILINNAINYLLNGTQFVAEKSTFRSKATGNWSTTVNSSWESSYDNTNWSQDVVVPAYANATSINVLNGHTITVDANATAPSVIIKSGANLSLADTKLLEITGNLTIESDGSNGTGTFVDANAAGGLTVSGTTTVNQNLTYRTWYITSPIDAAQPITSINRIKSYNEADNSWPTLFDSNLSVPIPYGSNSFEIGKGYLVVPNADATNIQFTGSGNGKLNNGVKEISLKMTDGATKTGFNLIGNPYPSYLDWTAVYTANSAKLSDATMWYRTKVGAEYKFWTVTGAGVGSTTEATQNIPPMQAFWVRTNANNSVLTLNKDMRSHAPASYKSLKAPAAKNAEMSLIRLQVSNGTNTDETVIYFSANATNGRDAFDAPKMSNDNAAIPEIYTTLGAEQLVINGMNTIPMDQEIGLGFVAGDARSFSLQANEVSNLPADVKLILKDNVTNAETDVTDGVTAYAFTPLAITGTRFSIIFRSAGAVTGVEKQADTKLMVYSNHKNQITLVNNDLTNLGSTVSVYNAVGQKLLSKQIAGSITLLDGNFTAGVYMVKVNSISKKVIVK